MKISELWAIGKDRDKALDRSDETEGYDLMWINIEELMSYVDPDFKLDINDPTGGKNGKEYRIERAKEHIRNKGFLDPAVVGYNEYTKTIDFLDGRHRLVAAYQLGHSDAPVLVPSRESQIFVRLFEVVM